MMTNKENKENQNSVPLVVTIQFNPKKQDLTNWVLSCSIEHYGVHIQNNKDTITNKEMVILFDKVKDGEDFHKIITNCGLKTTKATC